MPPPLVTCDMASAYSSPPLFRRSSYLVRLVDYGGVVLVGSADMRVLANSTLCQRHEFAIKAKLSGIAPIKVWIPIWLLAFRGFSPQWLVSVYRPSRSRSVIRVMSGVRRRSILSRTLSLARAKSSFTKGRKPTGWTGFTWLCKRNVAEIRLTKTSESILP